MAAACRAVLLIVSLGVAHHVAADGGRLATGADSMDLLTLSRVIVAECGRQCSSAEASAILHVLEARRRHVHISLAGMAKRYSVSHNGRSRNPERAARMRALTREQIPRHILALVEAWQRGIRPRSVCAGARHFAHPSLPTPLVRVTCATETRNAFWR